jgi:N-methylhydantoinase B
MSTERGTYTLDPVTFEVLKNAFMTTVDLMAEQILRTCHSFVIYARDFSSALCDRNGDTVMQGSQDIAVHVGTLHYKAKAVIATFGDDIHEGDVFAINDPYLGGTHFNDVSIIRPVFHGGEIIAFAQSNGHWADMGGSVPGSFDVNAKDHFGEGLRIPPVRLWDRGRYLVDVARCLLSNTRAPADTEGDLHAQAEATRVGEREILRLVEKYGRDTVLTAFDEVQNYVERLTRRRVAELPDGVWEAEDHIDYDPDREEGLVPIKVKLTIDGDQLHYDLSGSHPAVGTFLNSGFGASTSGVVAGTKTFFPDVPLNSGFYRAVDVDLGPVGSVVNAPWPVAVTGFCSGPYEKIMNATFEIWSQIVPERAIACSFNLEYLLVGGRDARVADRPFFMWYDWMVGGWGGRNGKDGSNCTAPLFGVGLAVQPLEGQERLSPVVTTGHEIVTDSGGPGRYLTGARASCCRAPPRCSGRCCDAAPPCIRRPPRYRSKSSEPRPYGSSVPATVADLGRPQRVRRVTDALLHPNQAPRAVSFGWVRWYGRIWPAAAGEWGSQWGRRVGGPHPFLHS